MSVPGQKFDRSAFKATKTADVTAQSKEVDAKTKSGDRAEILSLKKDNSKNRLRIFPKHPGTKYYSYPLHKHLLKVQSTDKEGNPLNDSNGNPEIKNRAIFNAKIHGQKDETEDIVDEYIARVYKRAYDEIQDEPTRKKFLSPITGYKGTDNKWVPGIAAMKSWIIYGDLNGKFGRVELPVSVKDKLNEVAAQQDMDADPFTDPDTGRIVFITFDPTENDPKKKYSVAIDLSGPSPLTDEQFDALQGQKPLEEIYENTYTRRDFDRAVEGLKRFDEESVEKLKKLGFPGGYEIFTFDEFFDVAERIAEKYQHSTNDNEEEEEESSSTNTNASTVPFETDNSPAPINKAAEVTAPVLDINKPLDQQNVEELKLFISTNKLDIRVLPSYTADMLRQFINEEMAITGGNVAASEPASIEATVISTPAAGTSRMDRLNNLQK